MQLEDIRAVLHRALPIRVPQFDPNTHPSVKVAALSDHLLLCAYQRGELEEALHWCIEAGKALRRQWDHMEGYEVALPRGTRHTKEQIETAKRTVSPGVWDGLEECRTLVESLRRQIVRLGGSDYDAASRYYTVISGS